MSIFRTRGFDSIISKGVKVRGEIAMQPGSTFIIDGSCSCTSIHVLRKNESVKDTDRKSTLRVNGYLDRDDDAFLDIDIPNVIITGTVYCDELRVRGTLAVKAGATLNAKRILYRKLIVETGAVMQGDMIHLDEIEKLETPALPNE